MSNAKQKHFDSWHNPIMGLYEMRDYYAGCKRSTEVLRRFMPVRYVAIPTTRIVLAKGSGGDARIERVWPGGSDVRTKFLSDHQVKALRRLYKAPRGGWRVLEGKNTVTFVRTGFLIPVRAYKYHYWGE